MQPARRARHPALANHASEDVQVVQVHRSHRENATSRQFSIQNIASASNPAHDEPCALAERPARPPTWRVVASGIVALAVAMGIGRFAFTPLLPLMLRDGTLGAATGAEWAAANYAGYLAGALTASWFSADPQRGLRLALFGIALATLAMAWLDGPAPGGGRRAAARRRGRLQCLGPGLHEQLVPGRTGPAAGTAPGRLGLHGRGPGHRAGRRARLARRAAAGPVAVAGTGAARRRGRLVAVGRLRRTLPASVAAATATAPREAMRGHFDLVLCYGILGFGYIVPATFLPAMARQQVADPLVFGLTWPVFGLAAALSVAAAARWLSAWPRQRVWALAHGAMALGTALPLASQALWALIAVGGARRRHLHGGHHGGPAAGARAARR